MILRKNRLLQIIIGLLAFTFLLPILLNVLVNNQQSWPDLSPYPTAVADGPPPAPDVRISSGSFRAGVRWPDPLNESYIQIVAGDSLDRQLAFRFAELSNRVQYAKMLALERKQEIFRLLAEIRDLRRAKSQTPAAKNQSTNSGERFREMFQEMVQVPSLLDLLPHVNLTTADAFNPAFHVANNETSGQSRQFVFGLPTVKRLVESYLISTLKNLIENLSPFERQRSRFVVFIAETDMKFVRKTATEIGKVFGKEIDSGLVEIISPPANYYPDFSRLKQTLGDPMERVRWRTKQNFDFAYLMMYCQNRGTYYVQLEDDIISKPSYLSKMENAIAKHTQSTPDWIILEFCSLGFIGKLFRTSDLSHFVLFFMMFQNDKPVDWLLDHYVQTKVCRFDKDVKDCKRRKSSVWITTKPSLFQHIGTHSSLKGKIQKLRDKGFGKLNVFRPHPDNPPYVSHYCTIKQYQNFGLKDAYYGWNHFWGMAPVFGDHFGFVYDPAINIGQCIIRTGSVEHPADVLYNATLYVRPFNAAATGTGRNRFDGDQLDGFVSVGQFDGWRGSVDVTVPATINPIAELLVVVEQNSTNWVIINEIYVQELKEQTTVAIMNANGSSNNGTDNNQPPINQ